MPSPRKSLLCRYHYDPLDRLMGSALPNTQEHQRFYCKNRLSSEIQGALRYSIVQQNDQLLAQTLGDGNTLDTTLLATDQQRSVLQTLQTNDQRQAFAYSPYGHRPIENGLLSLLGFNGERPDPVTGHYLLGNGYRAFNPVLMRFNGPDSLSPFGKGGPNPYAYCLADPVNREDSNGHVSFRIAVKAIIFVKRLKTETASSRLLKTLTTISSGSTPHPLEIKATKQLLNAKNSSINLKMAALDKVGSIKDIKPDTYPQHALNDLKKSAEGLEQNLKLSRQHHIEERLKYEFGRRGRSSIQGQIGARTSDITQSGASSEPPPLSPTSQKLFDYNLDRLIDKKIANLRGN